MSAPEEQVPELTQGHWAIAKNGVGNKVDIWTCEVGAQPASIGADMVVDTDPRGGDPSVVLVEDANGSVRPIGPPETLANERISCIVKAKALRDDIMFDAFTHDDAWYDCDRDSRVNIVGRATKIASGVTITYPIRWVDADNNLREFENGPAFTAMGDALDQHVETCVFNYQVLKAQIGASPTPANVDVTTGWPANRILTPP